ncbi:MAG: Fe-S cluster assembly ATPase SufC [Candidatus Micrarchaeia archaeon]
MILELKDLHVKVGEKEILKGINLRIKEGEFHVLMGPNGAGKTTLAKAIMGHPGAKITGGSILVDGKPIEKFGPDKRAKLGLFLQFQNPVEIEGVGFVNFARSAKEELSGSVNMKEFMEAIKEYSEKLKFSGSVIGRNLNQGFSGGEKKKAEILQLALLKPKIAVLDEPDSGLDIDALKDVANIVNEIYEKQKMGLLVITHYSRILSYMKPKFVHVLYEGKIIENGGPEIVEKLEKGGYSGFAQQGSGAKESS